jgi:uncharacterized membrane protein YjgN (DUF898 family)
MSDPTEITAAPCATLDRPEPPAGAAAAPPEECRFAFTGSGKEYFRIWVVNLLLTVATLGIYSAWAKVRRLQYFDRNTTLAGASFDFHGDPKAILKGRLLGVALLALYHYAYGFSLAVGAAIAGVLLVALPFLLRSALRFRLANTSYRGLRFGFNGSLGGAYLAFLPPIATFLLPGALIALAPGSALGFASFLLYLGWPLMHGAMKRYQHAHLLYGAEQSQYTAKSRRFVGPYLRAILLGLAAMVAVAVVGAILGGVMHVVGAATGAGKSAVIVMSALVGLLSGYLTYLMLGPYLQVRIANLVWSNTAFRGVQVRSELSARAFARLQTANAVLTLLTLGLYRPFAVVRVYRYRLACMSLLAQGSFEDIAAGAAQRSGAGGDAVAELLGFDLSW